MRVSGIVAAQLVLSCAHRGVAVGGAPRGLAIRARSLGLNLAHLQVLSSEWRGFDLETMPVVVSYGDWAVLFDSKPAGGFEPLAGNACPCARKLGRILGIPAGQMWLIAPDKPPVTWRWADHPGARLAPGELLAIVVYDDHPLEQVTHELFHLYQESAWGFPDRFRGYRSYLSERSTYNRAMGPLLREQALLAAALRTDPGKRKAVLRDWLASRTWLIAHGIDGRSEDEHEAIEGTATCAEMEVDASARPGRRDDERRLAALLEMGGRDLAPEDWFHRVRYYATGAALCRLLSDGWPGWQSHAFGEARQGGEVSLAGELERRIGRVRQEAMSGLPPDPRPLDLDNGDADGRRGLDLQASATVDVDIPGQAIWSGVPAQWVENTGGRWIAIGDALEAATDAAVKIRGAYRVEGHHLTFYGFGPAAAREIARLCAVLQHLGSTTLVFRSPQMEAYTHPPAPGFPNDEVTRISAFVKTDSP